MDIGLHVKYPLLSYFKETFPTDIRKVFDFENICSVGVELFHAVRRTSERRTDEKTDMAKLIGPFRFIGNAPKK